MRRNSVLLILFSVLTGLCCSAASLSASEGKKAVPVVLWASSPVAPGETVLAHGGDFGTNPKIEISSSAGTKTLEPCSVTDTGLMFSFPSDWPACEAEFKIVSDEGSSKPYSINTPDIWWVQGDFGKTASPSGWIRLFGKGIEAPNGETRGFYLVDGAGNRAGGIERQEKIGRWSQKLTLTAEIAEGVYRVAWVDSVTGEERYSAPIKVSVPPNLYKSDIFNIVDYGAVPNDGKDDTEAIEKAMAELITNGGGTLFVPRGRFCMTKTIILPPYSVLKGVSQELSQIYWPDTDTPPKSLVEGDHTFSVQDIFLTSGFHLNGITDWLKPEVYGGKPGEPKGNVLIQNLTFRLLFSVYVNDHLDKAKERLSQIHYCRAVSLSGENVRILDSDIFAAAGGAFEIQSTWSEVARNKISRGGMIGWNGFRGSQLIFEDNHFGGANCTSFYGVPEMSENIYWGNNFHENCFDGNNRETITGDCRTHLFIGKAEIVDSTTIALAADRTEEKTKPSEWKKGIVQIAGNRGVGQLRRITNIEERDGKCYVTVDKPWEIEPNADSIFYIGTCRSRFIYTGNRAYDSTIALQLYGSMMESVIADNVTSRTGGYHADTMNGETSWFIQMLNNTIESGNSYRGPYNEVPPRDAHIALIANGNGTSDYDYPILNSSLIRNCRLLGNAHLELRGQMKNVLLEKNYVRDADCGAKITNEAIGLYQNANQFENVTKEQEKK